MIKFLIGLLLVFKINARYVAFQPEQVHLAYGETDDSIAVTWSTKDFVNESIVEYGLFRDDHLNLTQMGETDSPKKFVDGGSEKRSQFIHRVILTGLEPSTKYGKYKP